MRGSQWNKWNIHVHTKGTNKNDQFISVGMDEFFVAFFKKAVENQVGAIGITDYFSVENYIKAKQYVSQIHEKIDNEGNILFTEEEIDFINAIFIFPNIELRMLPSTDSGKLINIHCLVNPLYVSELDNSFFNSIENQDRFKMNRAGIIGYGRTLKPNLNDDTLYYISAISEVFDQLILNSDYLFRGENVLEQLINENSNSGVDERKLAFLKHYIAANARHEKKINTSFKLIQNKFHQHFESSVKDFLTLNDDIALFKKIRWTDQGTIIRNGDSIRGEIDERIWQQIKVIVDGMKQKPRFLNHKIFINQQIDYCRKSAIGERKWDFLRYR